MDAESFSFNDHDAITGNIQPDIDAARTGNGAAMRLSGFDHARIVGSLAGNPINLDPNPFVELFNHVGGSPDVQSKVISSDVQGNAASAGVEFQNWGGIRYTDLFGL